MPKPEGIKPASIVWIVVGLLASTAVVIFFWPAGNQLKAGYWRERLAAATDEQAEECLTRLSELGDPGLAGLVEALGSSRPQIVTRARTLLLRQVDAWELLSIRQAAPRLITLAEALAQHVGEFEVPEQSLAADLSLRMMLWPGRNELTDDRRLLAACDKIVRTANSADAETRRTQTAGRATASEIAPDDVFSGHMLGPTALPGGSIPADPAQVTSKRRPNSDSSGAATAQNDPTAAAKPPLRFSPPAVARPLPAESPKDDPVAHAVANPQPSVAANMHATLNKQAAFLAAVNADETALVNMMRQLHSPDSREAAAAQQELERRGFKPMHLELAWSLTDNDPEIRRQLATVLPGVAGIDLRPWYLWLSHDEDPEVRLAALSFMVTSGDAQLHKRVEELGRTDPDPRVQQMALRPTQKRR